MREERHIVADTRTTETFRWAVGIFFAFVVLTIAIATFTDAPLSFDGAFFLFRVLDNRHFASDHGRLINIPLQLPTLIAARFTDNLEVLRPLFCAAYALIPLLGLTVSWMVCRLRGPSLFIWPVMSICLAGLPGQFSFHSEATIAVTLLWPAMLTALVGAPPTVLPLVAIASIAAACSHPYAAGVLAFIVLIALVSAIVRPQSRKVSIGLALALGALLLARSLARLDPYEGQALGTRTIVMSLNDSVLGWPLIAVALTLAAALAVLLSTQQRARVYLTVPPVLAGIALVLWAIDPRDWANCNDYRYWVAPIAILFMSGAAAEELWLRTSTESQLQEQRRHAVALIGAIFLVVLSIQCLQWKVMSWRLASDLSNSDRGCVSRVRLTSIRNTALDYWPLGFYAIELQSRTPHTLLLAHNFACKLFAQNGDAIMVDSRVISYVRPRDAGWFDFNDARSRIAIRPAAIQ
jgi:hypothetical protein